MRAPIYLYRAGVGWIFGHRFLMMTHIGRTTGRRRYVVLEVVDRDVTRNTYYVASGFGEGSDWLRNVQRNPRVEVRVSLQRFDATARRMARDEAIPVLGRYARAHPYAFQKLAAFFLGDQAKQADDLPERMAAVMPMVELRSPDPT
jgi:deazaflavin-dependent oxidoreductase (nitroreductase family)